VAVIAGPVILGAIGGWVLGLDKTAYTVLSVIAAIGGIGFTVSLFIAELAYQPGAVQDAAKLGVLGASMIAALLGATVLVRACRRSGQT